MKFDLKLAMKGYEVVTREGKSVRIICSDCAGKHPVIALLKGVDGEETICAYETTGQWLGVTEHKNDLILKPKTCKRYFAMFRRKSDGALAPSEKIYVDRESAVACMRPGNHNNMFEPLYVQEIDFVEKDITA